jgi:hypothetical protein
MYTLSDLSNQADPNDTPYASVQSNPPVQKRPNHPTAVQTRGNTGSVATATTTIPYQTKSAKKPPPSQAVCMQKKLSMILTMLLLVGVLFYLLK